MWWIYCSIEGTSSSEHFFQLLDWKFTDSSCLNSQEIIQHLKLSCPAHIYATSMSPPAVQQVISAIKVILGEDGSNRGTSLFFCFDPFNALQAIHVSFTFNSYLFWFWCLAGAQKLARIRENSNFFRSELKKMGFEVLGDNDSPVMPIMLYNPAKIPAFSRECLRQKVSNGIECYLSSEMVQNNGFCQFLVAP